MTTSEILILVAYFLVSMNIVFYNHLVIKKSKDMSKVELINLLQSENKYINLYILSSVLITGFIYKDSSIYFFTLFFILTFILIFSFSAMKKNLIKELNKRS